MQLLYGTANAAKVQHMKQMLKGLDIEITGLKGLDLNIKKINESGNSPLENAKIKALTYFKAAKMPVFSCDSGLYIDGLGTKNQPGVHIRRVNGRVLNDEEMIEYYIDMHPNSDYGKEDGMAKGFRKFFMRTILFHK